MNDKFHLNKEEEKLLKLGNEFVEINTGILYSLEEVKITVLKNLSRIKLVEITDKNVKDIRRTFLKTLKNEYILTKNRDLAKKVFGKYS